MAAVDVGGEFVEQVPLVGDANFAKVPKMMMRVANGKFGFQGFFLVQGQPVVSSKGHSVTSVNIVPVLFHPVLFHIVASPHRVRYQWPG